MGQARFAEVLRASRDVRAWALVFALVIGCGDAQGAPAGSGGSAGGPGAGTGGGGTSAGVASITIDSEPASGTHLGQRWVLEATARNEAGDPIDDVVATWSSSDPSVASVSERGVVTARLPGTASITATAQGTSDSVTVTARSSVPSDVGTMYTLWFARSGTARVAVVDGRLRVFPMNLDGPTLTTPWAHAGVSQVASADGRIGILTDVVDGLGTFRVLDPAAEWSLIRIGDVKSFQLFDDWIAELDGEGALRVREGLEGDWITVEESGVDRFLVLGDRIAVLKGDGTLLAKDSLADPWTMLAAGVRSFVLDGDRIAVLLDEGDGTLQVKDGLDGPFETLEVRVRQVALSGDRIGVLRKDGVARVKEGIDGPWIQLASSYVEAIELEDDRVAIQFEGGDLRARDGVEGPWTVLSTSSRRFALREDSIAMVTIDGQLWFKTGLDGPWAEVVAHGDVTEWLSEVRVPVPPARTVLGDLLVSREPCAGLDTWTCPTSYAESQQRCLDDGDRCKSAPEPASPFPAYGRFCGVGRPLEADWEWAIGPDAGPIDAFDALCMHADHASTWYPGANASTVEACIVRYGLTTGRLTQDGVSIEPGSSEYAELMAELGNLGDVILEDAPYTTACDDDALQTFIESMQGSE